MTFLHDLKITYTDPIPLGMSIRRITFAAIVNAIYIDINKLFMD